MKILHRLTGAVLYKSNHATMKPTVEAAVSTDADLRYIDLSDANLKGASLADANFADACLSGADLSGANLSGANLSSTDLSGIDLGGARLRGAYLSDANLRGAYLADACLSGTDLSGANFEGADLSGVNLEGADLEGAHLTDVDAVIVLGQPNGWLTFAYIYEGNLMFRVGCKTKNLAEARAYWRKGHKEWNNRREVAECIEYAVRVAKLRGWDFKDDGKAVG